MEKVFFESFFGAVYGRRIANLIDKFEEIVPVMVLYFYYALVGILFLTYLQSKTEAPKNIPKYNLHHLTT